MDPLSATASVAGIVAFCLKTAKALESLRESYKHASGTIAALCSEAAVISASLAQVQGLLLRTQCKIRPELRDAFDIALTGCAVTFSCLDHEVQCLAQEADETNRFGWKTKARYVWKEEAMRDLLLQIRGQQTAISLLIQGLQMESFSEIQELLRGNTALLEGIMSGTRSNRSLNPSLKVPESVLGVERELDSLFGDQTSTVSGTEFDFDDLIVNSRAYRRALSIARRGRSQRQPEPTLVEGDLIDLSSNTDKDVGDRCKKDYSCGDAAQCLDALSSDPSVMNRQSSDTTRSKADRSPHHVASAEFPSPNPNNRAVGTPRPQDTIYVKHLSEDPTRESGPLHRNASPKLFRFSHETAHHVGLQRNADPMSKQMSSPEPSHKSSRDNPILSDQTLPNHVVDRNRDSSFLWSSNTTSQLATTASKLTLPNRVSDSDQGSWPLRGAVTNSSEATRASKTMACGEQGALRAHHVGSTESDVFTALKERPDSMLSPRSYQSVLRSDDCKFSDSGFYSQLTDDSICMDHRISQTRSSLPDFSRGPAIRKSIEVHLERLSGLSRLPDVQDDHGALSTIWKEIFRKQSSNLIDLADLIGDFGGLLNIESYNGRERLIQRETELFYGIEKLETLTRAFRDEFEPFRQLQNPATIFDFDDAPFI